MSGKHVVLNGKVFEIRSDIPIPPPRKAGRHKSINNDKELIARALNGLEKRAYKSYLQAANLLPRKSI